MTWRWIRTVLLILLLIANLVLFWTRRVMTDNRYTAGTEEMEEIREYLEDNSIRIEGVLDRKGYPQAVPVTGEMEDIGREVVERFLGTEYQTTYLDAHRSRHTAGTASVQLDPEAHRIQCRRSGAEMPAWNMDSLREQAASLLGQIYDGDDAELTEELMASDYAEFVFAEKKDNLYYYMNRAVIRLYEDGTETITLQNYTINGMTKKKHEICPLNELLFGAAGAIGQRGITEESDTAVIVDLRYGYDIDDTGASVYVVEFVLANGRTVKMDAIHNKVLR